MRGRKGIILPREPPALTHLGDLVVLDLEVGAHVTLAGVQLLTQLRHLLLLGLLDALHLLLDQLLLLLGKRAPLLETGDPARGCGDGAQKLLVCLSEPLKQWHLNKFESPWA